MIKTIEALGQPIRVLADEPMKHHTTFRTGGPADIYAIPETPEALAALLACLKAEDYPFFIIGNGSNLLVSDQGYRGAVIEIGSAMSRVTVNGQTILAEAGVKLSALAAAALEASLTGLEFAAGIPGNLGGAVFMNAGAYGGEMRQVIERVYVLTADGEFVTRSNEDMAFGYRTSAAKTNGDIVLAAEFRLSAGDAGAIRAQMDDLAAKRRDKQPLNFPSAGSTFKRPEGYFAGKLIQDAGLSGYQIGGARVSEKHCGFIINSGDAVSQDIYDLIVYVTKQVRARDQVTLEPEVRFLGEF
ncbi:MAG: UDP-N-acetylmuramate dehydrogenase [Lachnospiraceae bacterium]|nr:UDP-N-acetylmuramate dehydrogenase [Lachnospiraceae bacterium]